MQASRCSPHHPLIAPADRAPADRARADRARASRARASRAQASRAQAGRAQAGRAQASRTPTGRGPSSPGSPHQPRDRKEFGAEGDSLCTDLAIHSRMHESYSVKSTDKPSLKLKPAGPPALSRNQKTKFQVAPAVRIGADAGRS